MVARRDQRVVKVKDVIDDASRAKASYDLLEWLLEGQPPITQIECDAVEHEWRVAGRAPRARRKAARRGSQ